MKNRKRRRDLLRLGIPAGYAQERRLSLQREANSLVSVARTPEGRMIRLAPPAAAAWRRLHRAAKDAGVEIFPLSGFRSVARQVRIVREKLRRGEKIHDILRVVAAPGFSEHHTGRAIDVGTPGHATLDESFARTGAFRWLGKHAMDFGFHLSYPRGNPHGIAFEPWHWCWRRRARARSK